MNSKGHYAVGRPVDDDREPEASRRLAVGLLFFRSELVPNVQADQHGHEIKAAFISLKDVAWIPSFRP